VRWDLLRSKRIDQDFKGGWVGSVLNPIRRIIYPINPFASQQVPSHNSVGLRERWGNSFWPGFSYYSGSVFTNLFPNHFNDTSFKAPGDQSQEDSVYGTEPGPGKNGTLGTFKEDLPRGCERARMSYNRCKMVNGKEQCQAEGDWVMGVCPDWALSEIRNEKRFQHKVMLIQKAEYDSAMAVSSYNEGRTVADVSNKSHVHGTKQYLRPDTLWADERYVNVTRDEIEAAKKRHIARQQATGNLNTALKPELHHDRTGAEMKKERPLY